MGLSSYYRQYDNQNLAELERQKEALRQMSETQKQLVNENADASIKQIQEAGDAEIREAEHAYDGIINTANVQKIINERRVAERMANLGLTDSGLNRTQQTAVQVGHSNQINNIQVARQKQIDALALAINQQIGSVNIQRNNDLTNLDLSHQQNLYSLDEQYRANRDSWAASAYDADQQRAAAQYKAQLEYNENLIKMGLEAEENAEKKRLTMIEDRSKLISQLYDDDISDSEKMYLVEGYRFKYGAGAVDEGIHNIVREVGLTGQVDPKTNTSWNNGKSSKYNIYYDENDPEYEKMQLMMGYEDYFGTKDGAEEYAINQMLKSGRYGDNIEGHKLYTRAPGESFYDYAQRVADDSYLSSKAGKPMAELLGSPDSPKYSKEETGDIIYSKYEKGDISEAVALSLLRIYGI